MSDAATRSVPFQTVAVIGLGVMGGSLARALRTLEGGPRVVGHAPDPAEREAALAAGALDEASARADEAAAAGDLVVYATPLDALLELRAAHVGVWRAGAVVSDVSSLLGPLAEQAAALGFRDRWVGVHPMTGAEGIGFAASRNGLFTGVPVWTAGADGPARDRVEAMWRALGALPRATIPARHDARMVQASHLPQVVANALACALDDAGLGPDDLGPGGRDMTRLAASAPGMWRALLAASAPDLASAVRGLGAHLDQLATLLEVGDVDAVARVMARTRRWARGDAEESP